MQEIEMTPPVSGGQPGDADLVQDASLGPSFADRFGRFQGYREQLEDVSWEFLFIQSWATSTVDAYERHLKLLRQRHLRSPSASPIQVCRDYLLALYRCQQTSSDMWQAISACRLLEETKIAPAFVPRSIWRIVGAKDKVSHLSTRGWGSLSALWSMAQNAEGDEDVLVAALAVLAVAFCKRDGIHTGLGYEPS